MGRLSAARTERATVERDLTWALLWGLRNDGWPEGGWVSSRAVYDAWRDGRNQCGIAWADDWIGNRESFTRRLNRLVDEGRAEISRAPGRHPRYRAVEAHA